MNMTAGSDSLKVNTFSDIFVLAPIFYRPQIG